MDARALTGGFADPAREAAQAFRSVMEAMARPGVIRDIAGATPPAPLSPAAGAVILTLCDSDTPVHLAGDANCEAVRDWIAFHTGAPLAPAADCMFAVGTWAALTPLSPYPLGTSQYPDRSATLIVEMQALRADGATLSGPGIKTTAALSLPETEAFETNRRHFPRGLDFIFTSGTTLSALPRTTRVAAMEAL
ncbi:MAG: phosphonate C-P lyase system protein PhnH [Pseudomonadota bacterium]